MKWFLLGIFFIVIGLAIVPYGIARNDLLGALLFSGAIIPISTGISIIVWSGGRVD